ncbi:MAG: CHAP domain-containing protein [Candidatus Saccharibacteria bacterium]|nr:CHAP domain-containing protein [Candidatus Saccharibacteria bacterium]
MTAKTTKKGGIKQFTKNFLPYILSTIVIIGIVVVGSANKGVDENTGLNIQALASNNYAASADQISEYYMVSELAHVMNLATAEAVNVNYNSLTSLSEVDQTSTDKFEKPTNLNSACYATGVVEYKVSEGETVASISSKYAACGVTEVMIRWSNNMTNRAGVAAGQTIYVPARSGFVHKVVNGETIESLASKYKSSVENIVAANNLENYATNAGLPVGAHYLLPDGDMPATERPDYVAPTPTYTNTNYYTRIYWTSSNPMPYGWCTWYAWGRRAQLGGKYTLPGGLGNASTWDNSLAGSFYIDGTPRAGDVIQTDYGQYGHVGYVESVNGDYITISDMNGLAGWGRVGYQNIPRSAWGQYRFIHERK